jgi:hypothetical protein
VVSSQLIPQIQPFLKLVTGHGRLITVCDVDSPPAYPVMTSVHGPETSGTVLASSRLNLAKRCECRFSSAVKNEEKGRNQAARRLPGRGVFARTDSLELQQRSSFADQAANKGECFALEDLSKNPSAHPRDDGKLLQRQQRPSDLRRTDLCGKACCVWSGPFT